MKLYNNGHTIYQLTFAYKKPYQINVVLTQAAGAVNQHTRHRKDYPVQDIIATHIIPTCICL